MDLLNISRPWDCQVFPKSKTICYGGGGGGGGPVEEVVEVVSDTVSDNTPDIKIEVPEVDIDVPTPEEIVEQVDDLYQDSDVDTFLEDTQETGEFMLDVVKTIVTGEPQGDVKETQEALQETQQDYQDLADDFQTGLDNIQDVTTDTINTTNQVLTDIGTNVSEQFSEAMGLTDETQGGAVTEATRGGDVVRDEDLVQLGKKKSDLRAKKKRGKKGLRIDYGVSVPGMGKSGIAA